MGTSGAPSPPVLVPSYPESSGRMDPGVYLVLLQVAYNCLYQGVALPVKIFRPSYLWFHIVVKDPSTLTLTKLKEETQMHIRIIKSLLKLNENFILYFKFNIFSFILTT